jgi:hypothetical protein
MTFSRRSFMKWAAMVSTVAVTTSSRAGILPLARNGLSETGLRPDLLPSRQEVWDNLAWMAKLGPKYTGNKAHVTFVDFLADQMKKYGLEVNRDTYTFPRWEAKRWEISIQPASGASFKPAVTSYFPYSGQTPAAGVAGELVYAGFYRPQPPPVTAPGAQFDIATVMANIGAAEAKAFDLSNVNGKIVLVDFATGSREYGKDYQDWGVYPSDAHFPEAVRPARAAINDLTKFHKAGALAVILAWTDVSDANAQDQYTPFSRPPQGIPGLYVGKETGAKLKALAKGGGAKATVVLEADTIENSATDGVTATLPGTTSDEIIMVNTHTDGPNATEENGAIACLALAKYFAAMPRSERKRTLIFPMVTGHFALPWVPAIFGFIKKYPDTIKKTVATLTVEHLACQEWMDDATATHYKYTGQNQWSVAITEYKAMADILLQALQGSEDTKTGVVNPVHGGWLGEGAGPNVAGIPTIGYIPQPNYLLAGTRNGCIDKLDSKLLHSQIQVFAKALHRIDSMSAAELKVKSSKG